MALPNFPIDKAYLIASWCAAALWGSFTFIFISCMISVLGTRSGRPRNLVIIGGVIIMYGLATTHVSLTLVRNIEAFIVHVQNPGPVLYLADIGQGINRSKDMIYITEIVLGDSVLLWRCFMVWNRNYYVVAFPAIMILGTAISGYGAVGRYFTPNPYELASIKWAKGMLVISMVTNILLTSLTAGRIWKLSRDFSGMSFSTSSIRYNHVILLIVESGVIMTISKSLEFILFELSPPDGLVGLNALYIVMDCMPQIMGICPTFIIMCVNKGFSTTDPEAYTSGAYAPRGSTGRQSSTLPLRVLAKPGMAIETTTETITVRSGGKSDTFDYGK
ncbi:hypothetical protein NP233_g8994 [Leucocoprinus birnbaumii]|uniref:Uncharacterized protein n=1 Tax=Leucocoprinus birnbaumii TaxID=56174 RepID=A0AAD5YRA8_9AGAR|nr:hypothetical protein NP233_g8994 [Leucocoprinus birnbaumii]